MRILVLVLMCLAPLLAKAGGLPPEGEVRTHRGVDLVGTTYADRDSEDFFRVAGMAVDMVRSLPRAEWNRSGLIRRIIYNPPSKYRDIDDETAHFTGVYYPEPMNRWPAPMLMNRSARYASALELALAIVSAGILAEDHRKYVDMSGSAAGRESGEYRQLRLLMTKSASADVQLSADCRNLVAVYNALRILNPQSMELNQRVREINNRGCR
jgi:hypothetical protein